MCVVLVERLPCYLCYLLPLAMMWIFLDALLQLGIPAGVAQVVNEQFAKVESNAAHLAGLQQELAQMQA